MGPAAAKAKTQVWLVEHRNTNSFEHAAKLGIFSHHTLRLPEVNEVNEVNWLLLTMQNLGRGFMHGVGTACGAAHLFGFAKSLAMDPELIVLQLEVWALEIAVTKVESWKTQYKELKTEASKKAAVWYDYLTCGYCS